MAVGVQEESTVSYSTLEKKLAKYMAADQRSLVHTAYKLAHSAHHGQLRSDGEAYISHPLAVASILADMHMDSQSIAAAILHDVLEDTPLEKEAIILNFGQEVAELVDGVSKLTLIKFESRAEQQAENLRKMMLAMAKDIRVILIKLADRLHNMRTLGALPLEKQKRIAKETLEIYAPIANRLGMRVVCKEFEDLGFAHLYPMRYKIIKEALKKSTGNRKELILSFEQAVKERLEQEKVVFDQISSREKHLYSLYKKMRNKDLSLSEIMDVYALRIVVNSVDDCYRVLGIVHNLYKPIHGRFKDYIAVPKLNGYQSLHTTLIGQHGLPVEIQIRSKDMDRVAENGIAAHWLYKTGSNSGHDAMQRAREWLRLILEIQQNAGNSLEFIEHVKIDLYPDEVYVFTPDGDIMCLPSGSSCVDFAYAVHTDVGNACIAAKIDRRLMPLSSRLHSGQTVEIITATGAHPNPAWLGFVVTAKARSNIRHWLKTQQIHEARSLGQRLLERALSTQSLELENISNSRVDLVLKELKLNSLDDLYEAIGLGIHIAPMVARRLMVDLGPNELALTQINPLAIKGTEGMAVNYARCCRPIPGDPILGSLTVGRGIVIHREHCNNVANLEKNPEKYIYVQWAEQVSGEFQIELKISVLNKRGVLATLANIITDAEAHIENVHVDEGDARHFSFTFLIYVHSRIHLAKIMRKLRTLMVVTNVSRN
ncbi:MAG: RelA/SpoT family protein [Gammaproteobacteria bacterium]